MYALHPELQQVHAWLSLVRVCACDPGRPVGRVDRVCACDDESTSGFGVVLVCLLTTVCVRVRMCACARARDSTL